MKKYEVILADPPWRYDSYKKGGHGKARDHYDDMSLGQISDILPFGARVDELTTRNAVLFLWVTWPLVFDAERIVDEWGFVYKTIAWVWVKSREGGFGHHMGMGAYTRANSEPCLLATKGSMTPVAHDVLSIIYSPVRRHSKKPEEQYDKICEYTSSHSLHTFSSPLVAIDITLFATSSLAPDSIMPR